MVNALALDERKLAVYRGSAHSLCSGFVADRPMVVVAATVGSDVNALFIAKRTLLEQSAIKKKKKKIHLFTNGCSSEQKLTHPCTDIL